MTTGKGRNGLIGLEQMGLAVTQAEWASAVVRRLEDATARRLGVTLHFARQSLARRLRTTPDTLRNLRRGRTQNPRAALFDAAVAALIEDLQAEVRELEHEIQLYRQVGAHDSRHLLHEAEGQVRAARRLLEEFVGGW